MIDLDSLPVIFLMGPTASGKTDVAAQLSESFALDLISVDAAQVYKHMDIGTAKPDAAFLDKYPHQLIDIRHPENAYSAADFVDDAAAAIRKSHANRRVPVLVGGTLFYFKALEQGLSELPSSDAELRKQIEEEIEKYGVAEMHQRLMEVDSSFVQKIKPNDRQRVQRAMEIFRSTGRPPSLSMTKRRGLDVPLIKITLFTPDRKKLHKRIATRFNKMLERGLVEEVALIVDEMPGALSAPSMRTVGYRQVIPYLKSQITHAQMVENSVAATRQLAKRQLTWLRQQSGVTWVEGGCDHTLSSVKSYLQQHPSRVAMVMEGISKTH